MVFPLKKLGSVLGAPALLFYTLPMLIVILVVGTIAQKWVGLHLALETYFYSWIIWKIFSASARWSSGNERHNAQP